MDRLVDIFDRQYAWQRSLGFNFGEMTTQEQIDYIKEMSRALEVEMIEALNETTWKPWATGNPNINRNTYVGELVDALHFFVNCCLVVGVTPGELHERYVVKREINLRRQREGYDGRSTKCPICGRALDDPNVQCTREKCWN